MLLLYYCGGSDFFFFIYLYLNRCIVPLRFLPWEIRVTVPVESQLRQNLATQPKMHARCFTCFNIPPNSDMDYRVFNVHTDVNAYDCTRGYTDTVRESELKVDSGRKILCCSRESNLHQWRAGPTLYHLSYISVQCYCLCSCVFLISPHIL